jgi:hypothetical protein
MELLKYTMEVEFTFYDGNLEQSLIDWLPQEIEHKTEDENGTHFRCCGVIVSPRFFIVKLGKSIKAYKNDRFYEVFDEYKADYEKGLTNG